MFETSHLRDFALSLQQVSKCGLKRSPCCTPLARPLETRQGLQLRDGSAENAARGGEPFDAGPGPISCCWQQKPAAPMWEGQRSVNINGFPGVQNDQIGLAPTIQICEKTVNIDDSPGFDGRTAHRRFPVSGRVGTTRTKLGRHPGRLGTSRAGSSPWRWTYRKHLS